MIFQFENQKQRAVMCFSNQEYAVLHSVLLLSEGKTVKHLLYGLLELMSVPSKGPIESYQTMSKA